MTIIVVPACPTTPEEKRAFRRGNPQPNIPDNRQHQADTSVLAVCGTCGASPPAQAAELSRLCGCVGFSAKAAL